MPPDVLLRKLERLRILLGDLDPYRDADAAVVAGDHYKVERILELLATAGADVLQHLLAQRDVIAESYRDVFRRAATHGLIDADLAGRLEDAAAMRNVLVHPYDDIDLEIVHASVNQALTDFTTLVVALEPLTDDNSVG